MTTVTHLHPTDLPRNPAFAAGVSVVGPARTIYVGGQNGVLPDGTSAGPSTGTQTEQALRNVELVLAEGGAQLRDLVYWRIALAEDADLAEAFAAFMQYWGTTRGEPPAISVERVLALANPDFFVEITAVAAVAVPQ